MKHYKKGRPYISPAAWILAAGGFSLFFSLFFNLIRAINQSDVFGMNPVFGKISDMSMLGQLSCLLHGLPCML